MNANTALLGVGVDKAKISELKLQIMGEQLQKLQLPKLSPEKKKVSDQLIRNLFPTDSFGQLLLQPAQQIQILNSLRAIWQEAGVDTGPLDAMAETLSLPAGALAPPRARPTPGGKPTTGGRTPVAAPSKATAPAGIAFEAAEIAEARRLVGQGEAAIKRYLLQFGTDAGGRRAKERFQAAIAEVKRGRPKK